MILSQSMMVILYDNNPKTLNLY